VYSKPKTGNLILVASVLSILIGTLCAAQPVMESSMRLLFSAALVGASMIAAPALAWTSESTQPTADGMLVYGYNTTNYCPAGLQPVVVGGVVCCGVANTTNYQSHPAPRHKPRRYVSYSKGTVVYEKGQ